MGEKIAEEDYKFGYDKWKETLNKFWISTEQLNKTEKSMIRCEIKKILG